ncbi:MAG: hypothetical protein HYU73_25950, partial [Betaproteobacteria bacterium]|nr:hypothetical protein [Betaproteobacteria bacterium]
LDSKTGQMIYELLKEIAKERTVIVVTHAEPLAQLADRIVHIKDGRLTSYGEPAASYDQPLNQERSKPYV